MVWAARSNSGLCELGRNVSTVCVCVVEIVDDLSVSVNCGSSSEKNSESKYKCKLYCSLKVTPNIIIF